MNMNKSKKCVKCGKEFKAYEIINGKLKNYQNRKYCFECSPFAKHNTKNFEKIRKPLIARNCPICGREYIAKGSMCAVCGFNKRSINIRNKVTGIIGDSCCICGYNKTWNNICMHHVNPETKLMNLTLRELMGNKWDTVFLELQKCIPLCYNCHGEFHAGLISEEYIKKLHLEFWSKILVS